MKIDELVCKYIALRDLIAADDEAYKAKQQTKKDMLDKIEAVLKKHFDATNTDSLSVRGVGTAFTQMRTSVTVSEWDAAWEYIQKEQAYDMLEHRVNKTAAMARLKETGELPPGLSMSQTVVVNIRRS